MCRVIFLSALLISPAQARVVHITLDSCVFTIGSFCPVESLGMTAFVAVVLGLVLVGIAGAASILRTGHGAVPGTPEGTSGSLFDIITRQSRTPEAVVHTC